MTLIQKLGSAFLMAAWAFPALADSHHWWRRAPEPVTLVGLGVGAGVVGLSAWRKRNAKK